MFAPHLRNRLRIVLALVALAGSAGFATVQSQAPQTAVTADDYSRAATLLAASVNPLVIGGSVSVNDLPGERFWYRSVTPDGVTFYVVAPVAKSRVPAFDHARLSAALSKAASAEIDAKQLPFQTIELSADGRTVSFDYDRRRWACDVKGASCASTGDATGARGAGGRGGRGGRGGARGGGAAGVASPDQKRAVFIKDWNLVVRDVATRQETPLTTDGVKDFGYATDNAGWASSDRAIVLWSPDSKKIATYQQDEREVGEMYLTRAEAGHPELRTWKYPLPGDQHVAMMHRVIIDADSGKVVRFQMPPDYHRAMLGDNFSLNDLQWSPDATELAFVSTSRDHKQAVVRVANAATGAVRTVFEETEKTQFESRAGWRVLWASNEIIWSSQRDNWSQLYLYDLRTGALKNQITTGEGPVTQIAMVDEKARTIWFTAMGREKGQDPYFRHLYKVGFDGKGLASLTPDDGDHSAQLSSTGSFIVDTFSTCEKPPVVVLRDGEGRLLMPLEKADITKLLATGWKPPVPIVVKARDGRTDLYGMMFQPTRLDKTKKYPIINQAYPGPQSGSVGSRSFAAARGDRQALAELGFIVVSIDGMGTPGRSKSFHDAYYGAMGRDNTIPDQVAGMKELAQKYPWIDIDRAAIWGHSGGGFIAADAMFRYPDFFKVGISESGNHDQRAYEDDWGERYQGLLEKTADGRDNYDVEANQSVAKNLKGRLLLAHGLMDNNVPPYNTLLVVDALIKANKDFDLLLFPYQAHGYGADSNYMMRRRWDYFVRWLLGVEPPREFAFEAPATPGAGR
jgi:dipeptidyl-peptidase-4